MFINDFPCRLMFIILICAARVFLLPGVLNEVGNCPFIRICGTGGWGYHIMSHESIMFKNSFYLSKKFLPACPPIFINHLSGRSCHQKLPKISTEYRSNQKHF